MHIYKLSKSPPILTGHNKKIIQMVMQIHAAYIGILKC